MLNYLWSTMPHIHPQQIWILLPESVSKFQGFQKPRSTLVKLGQRFEDKDLQFFVFHTVSTAHLKSLAFSVYPTCLTTFSKL